MRFTCTLAAFLVAAAAAASIVGAAPLPGISSGQAEARGRRNHVADPGDPWAALNAVPGRHNPPVSDVPWKAVYACCDAELPDELPEDPHHDDDDDGFAAAKMRNDGIWVVSTGGDCATTCASESRVCTAESKAAQTELNTPEAIKAAVLEATGKKCAEDLLGHSRDYHGAPFVTGLSGEIECVIFTPGSLQQSSCTGLAYPNLRPLCRCFKDDTWSSGIGNEWTLELATPIYKSDGADETYDSMASMCTAAGSTLCSVEQVCPDGGANTTPVGGQQDFDDMWLPVVDTDQPGGKQWVQVGRRAGGTCNRLTAYYPADAAGSWMETAIHTPVKQMYACCGGSSAVSYQTLTGRARPPTYKNDGAGRDYGWMASMCTADGSALCSVDQVCPDGGANTSPIGGTQNFDDMWLPVKDAAQPGGKQWVQVGRRAGGTCNRLTAYHAADTAGSWMETTGTAAIVEAIAAAEKAEERRQFARYWAQLLEEIKAAVARTETEAAEARAGAIELERLRQAAEGAEGDWVCGAGGCQQLTPAVKEAAHKNIDAHEEEFYNTLAAQLARCEATESFYQQLMGITDLGLDCASLRIEAKQGDTTIELTEAVNVDTGDMIFFYDEHGALQEWSRVIRDGRQRRATGSSQKTIMIQNALKKTHAPGSRVLFRRLPNGNNGSTTTHSQCTDSGTWQKGTSVKNCKWIGEQDDKTRKKWCEKKRSTSGVYASEACKITCGTCPL